VSAWSSAVQRSLALYPDTLDTLIALRAAGLRLGLITNGPSAWQRLKLEQLALTNRFDAIVVDTEFGYPKPDRRIFDHAAGLVGLTAGELVFVGDQPERDVEGARAAGWMAVWYNPQDDPWPPSLELPARTVRCLAQVLALPEIADALRHRGSGQRIPPPWDELPFE
jgi:putative hydrolase of the HAD superfamily